jgi:hypothetical protein
MRRGDPDPRRGVHGFQQISRQVAQRAVEHGHGLRREGKPRVGISDPAPSVPREGPSSCTPRAHCAAGTRALVRIWNRMGEPLAFLRDRRETLC